MEARDQRRADADHHAAHHQRAEDAPEQHAVLVDRRHREEAEDHRDDEDVVDAERFLDDVAGEVLDGGARPSLSCPSTGSGLVPKPEPVILVAEVDEDREGQRHADPDGRPASASFTPTTCALRWKTPRSRASSSRMTKTMNPSQIQIMRTVLSRDRWSCRLRKGSQCARRDMGCWSTIRVDDGHARIGGKATPQREIEYQSQSKIRMARAGKGYNPRPKLESVTDERFSCHHRQPHHAANKITST